MDSEMVEMQTKSTRGVKHEREELIEHSFACDVSSSSTLQVQEEQTHQKVDQHMAVLMWCIAQTASQHTTNTQTTTATNTAKTTTTNTTTIPTRDDFKAYVKLKIDHHMHSVDNLPIHFTFKEYMPKVFRSLRSLFGIDESSFMSSFVEKPPAGITQSGRSGASFYLTHDKRFLVKSMSKEEVSLMHSTMTMYYTHIKETIALTLLPQHLAIYRISVSNSQRYFIVLRNVFSPKKKINKNFDLKGSTISRNATESEKAKECPTLKDNDFRNYDMRLKIGEGAKTELLTNLRMDVEFLSSLNLMDYSLLIGIHTTSPRSERQALDITDVEVEPGESDLFCIPGMTDESGQHEVYYLGIIDILSYYGSLKKTAHCMKTCKYELDAGISTVNPQFYGSRFLEFIDTVFE